MDVRINLFRDKWLLHVVVHPQFVAMPHILGRCQGGSEQDGRVPVRLTDAPYHLEAVHFGHVDVGQDDVGIIMLL